jgi:hypothetical protein
MSTDDISRANDASSEEEEEDVDFGDLDARGLCEAAGVDPDRVITKFVTEDYAAVLCAMEEQGKLTREQTLERLRKMRPDRLDNALLDASLWTDVYEIFALVGD